MAALHAAAFTQSRPWSELEFSGLLATSGTFAIGHSDAFALVRVIADEAELLTIATHPARRRLGLARALMRAWEAEAAARGAGQAFLEVAEDNLAARALYAATGYAETGRRKGYYARATGPAVDALVLARPLPGPDPDPAGPA